MEFYGVKKIIQTVTSPATLQILVQNKILYQNPSLMLNFSPMAMQTTPWYNIDVRNYPNMTNILDLHPTYQRTIIGTIN